MYVLCMCEIVCLPKSMKDYDEEMEFSFKVGLCNNSPTERNQGMGTTANKVNATSATHKPWLLYKLFEK